MIRSLAFACLLSATAWSQDPPPTPRRPEGDRAPEGDRRPSLEDLQQRERQLKQSLVGAESPQKEEIERQLKRVQDQIKRLKDGPRPDQPGRFPDGGPREGRPPMPPDPPGPPDRGDRRPMPPFNPEEVHAWLRDNEPETFRRLTQLEEQGKREESTRIMVDASFRMRELNELKQRDPKGYEKMVEMRKLERETVELGEQARRASSEERDASAKKLQEKLGRLFDLREEARAKEITELKRRVEALEKALNDRKTGKDRIVEKRRRELMGEKVDEDW